MLLQFAVENFLSFRDKTVFSMRAAANVERGPEAPDVVRGSDIARCAALYGANASGKSNFIKALSFAQELVVLGVEEPGRILTRPFRLDAATAGAPSSFEFYLRSATGRTYCYGFVVRPEAIVHEWLSELDGENEVEIFNRDGGSFTFALPAEDPALELLTLVGSATRDNQLFLRTAREFKLDRFPRAFADVLAWFKLTLVIIDPEAKYGPLIAQTDKDPQFREFLGEILRRADTGISEIQTIRRKLTKDERVSLSNAGERRGHDVEEERGRAHYASEGDDVFRVELRLRHGSEASEDEGVFELSEESDGTVRLLDLSPVLFHARGPLVFIVDELDRSLHTALSRWLVERFVAEGAGTTSQLIFTTHDTNLLDLESLRTDSIWFAEKNERGVSLLYSLAEFKAEQVAQLRKNLEQAYLVGRFGGVPRLREGS